MARLSTGALVLVLVAFQLGCQADELAKIYKSDWDRNKLPDYPGLSVYQELEEILREEVKSDSVEANFAQLEDMSNKLPHRLAVPRALLDAVNLVYALKFVVDEKRCDYLAARASVLNLNALANGDSNKSADKLARLQFLIKKSFEKIVATCTDKVEENLQQAVSSVQRQDYQKLTAYLSDEFISKWTEQGKKVTDIGIQYAKLNPNPNWSRQAFNQHDLMLNQLFHLQTVHPQPLQGRELYYVMKSGEYWPKMKNQQVLKDLVRADIIKPCMSYLKQVDNNVFRLIYAMAKQNGPEWSSSFMGKRSKSFLAHHFRYEFCHLEAPIVGLQLWKHYFESTRPLDVVEKVTKAK